MDDGSKCMKYMIFVANIIFLLLGLALVGLGAVPFITNKPELVALKELFPDAPWAFIALGIFIFVVSFLGCCGAVKENNCMLISFATVVAMIAAITMTFGVLMIVKPDLIEDYAVTAFNYLVDHNDNKIMDTAIHNIEELLSCCSNIDRKTPNNTGRMCTYSRGCQKALNVYIQEHHNMVGFVASAVSVLGFMGVVLVSMLTCSIRSSQAKYSF